PTTRTCARAKRSSRRLARAVPRPTTGAVGSGQAPRRPRPLRSARSSLGLRQGVEQRPHDVVGPRFADRHVALVALRARVVAIVGVVVAHAGAPAVRALPDLLPHALAHTFTSFLILSHAAFTRCICSVDPPRSGWTSAATSR